MQLFAVLEKLGAGDARAAQAGADERGTRCGAALTVPVVPPPAVCFCGGQGHHHQADGNGHDEGSGGARHVGLESSLACSDLVRKWLCATAVQVSLANVIVLERAPGQLLPASLDAGL